MDNNYRIMGLAPGASEEQVKETYRKLAQQYNPDNFTDAALFCIGGSPEKHTERQHHNQTYKKGIYIKIFFHFNHPFRSFSLKMLLYTIFIYFSIVHLQLFYDTIVIIK